MPRRSALAFSVAVTFGFFGFSLATSCLAQTWSSSPNATQTAAMLAEMVPVPGLAANIADARNIALLPALRTRSLGQPVTWRFTFDAQTVLTGTAVVDAPVPERANCYYVSYYGYDPGNSVNEEVMESVACQGAHGEWLFSNYVVPVGYIPKSSRVALRCPTGRRSCSREEGRIEHTRSNPTQLRANYAASRQTAVAAPERPTAPTPVDGAQRATSASLNKLIDAIVSKDAASWKLNEYVYDSVQNARIISGGGDSFVATADYAFRGYSGSKRGWVKVVFKKGELTCLEFWDQPGVCRPLGYSLTKQMAAANSAAPIHKGESDEAAYERFSVEGDALRREYARVFDKMKREATTDRAVACKTSKYLVEVADKMVANESAKLKVFRYKEQLELLNITKQIRVKALSLSSSICS